MAKSKNGSVYALTNPAFPHLIKIGQSKEPAKRAKTLASSTGVPGSFEVACECKVENPKEVEKALHDAFRPYRHGSGKKEFFEIEVSQLIGLFQVLDQNGGEETKNARGTRRGGTRRGNTNLRELGIMKGDVLTFTKDNSKKATVIDDYRILYGGEIMNLTTAAKKIIGDKSISGPDHWMFKGVHISVLKRNRKEMTLF